MKLVLFDKFRVGALDRNGSSVVDVTDLLPYHDVGLGANFWVRMCADMEQLLPKIRERVGSGSLVSLNEVRLRAPVLNPSKIVAAAVNYAEHTEEMRPRDLPDWMLKSDIFLKAPSSITGPESDVILPNEDDEFSYEAELAAVIGVGGKNIPVEHAMSHVVGWTVLLDMTERGSGDRSRRKSYDTFTPIGPWLLTADSVPRWQDLHIELRLNGILRQSADAGEMTASVPLLVSGISDIMGLVPGDVIATGTPAGVGRVSRGDSVDASISGGLGHLRVRIR